MLQSLREETEGKLQMLLSPRKNGLTSLFKEVRVFKVIFGVVRAHCPPSFLEINRRHAERVWAYCLRKLFSVGFIGVGGFGGWVFLPCLLRVGIERSIQARGFSNVPGRHPKDPAILKILRSY